MEHLWLLFILAQLHDPTMASVSLALHQSSFNFCSLSFPLHTCCNHPSCLVVYKLSSYPIFRSFFPNYGDIPTSHGFLLTFRGFSSRHRATIGQHVGPQRRVGTQTAQQGDGQMPGTRGDGGVVPEIWVIWNHPMIQWANFSVAMDPRSGHISLG